jgi:hypothetical protein
MAASSTLAHFLKQLLGSWLSTFVSARSELGEDEHRGINREMDFVHGRRGGEAFLFIRKFKICETH